MLLVPAVCLILVLGVFTVPFVAVFLESLWNSVAQLPQLVKHFQLRRSGLAWTGMLKGVPVRLGLRLELLPPCWHLYVRVPAPTRGLSLRWGMVGPDQHFGDPRVDDYLVAGPSEELARLGPEIREVLGRLRGNELSVGNAAVQIAWTMSSLREGKYVVEAAVILAQTLGQERTARELLADRVLRDPMPEVRARFLQRAAKVDPGLQRELARSLLADPDPTLRCHAALLLDEHEALVAAACDPAVDVLLRWKAGGTLLRRGTDRERYQVARALLGDPRQHDLALALLSICSDPGVEDLALDLLERDLDSDVLGRVVDLLASSGTPRALPALRALQQRLSVLRPGLQAKTRSAIQALEGQALSLIHI